MQKINRVHHNAFAASNRNLDLSCFFFKGDLLFQITGSLEVRWASRLVESGTWCRQGPGWRPSLLTVSHSISFLLHLWPTDGTWGFLFLVEWERKKPGEPHESRSFPSIWLAWFKYQHPWLNWTWVQFPMPTNLTNWVNSWTKLDSLEKEERKGCWERCSDSYHKLSLLHRVAWGWLCSLRCPECRVLRHLCSWSKSGHDINTVSNLRSWKWQNGSIETRLTLIHNHKHGWALHSAHVPLLFTIPLHHFSNTCFLPSSCSSGGLSLRRHWENRSCQPVRRAALPSGLPLPSALPSLWPQQTAWLLSQPNLTLHSCWIPPPLTFSGPCWAPSPSLPNSSINIKTKQKALPWLSSSRYCLIFPQENIFKVLFRVTSPLSQSSSSAPHNWDFSPSCRWDGSVKVVNDLPLGKPSHCHLYLTWPLSAFFNLSHSSLSLHSTTSPGWAFWVHFLPKSLANFHSLLLSTPDLDVGPYSFSFFLSSLSLPLVFPPPTSISILLHSTAPCISVLFLLLRRHSFAGDWYIGRLQVIGRFGVLTQMNPSSFRLVEPTAWCAVYSDVQ